MADCNTINPELIELGTIPCYLLINGGMGTKTAILYVKIISGVHILLAKLENKDNYAIVEQGEFTLCGNSYNGRFGSVNYFCNIPTSVLNLLNARNNE